MKDKNIDVKINLVAGDNSLTEKSRQQTAANRQAFEENQRIKNATVEEKKAEPVILPQQRQPPKSPKVRKDEPAAARLGGYKVAAAFITVNGPSITIQTADKSQQVQINRTNGQNPIENTDYYYIGYSRTISGKPSDAQLANLNGPGGPPVGTSWNGTVSESTGSQYPQNRTTNEFGIVAIPAGGRNMIIYYKEDSIFTRARSTFTATATSEVGLSVPIPGFPQTKQIYTTVMKSETHTYEHQQRTGDRCFLVSPSSIQEISTPSLFRDTMRQFIPDLEHDMPPEPAGLASRLQQADDKIKDWLSKPTTYWVAGAPFGANGTQEGYYNSYDYQTIPSGGFMYNHGGYSYTISTNPSDSSHVNDIPNLLCHTWGMTNSNEDTEGDYNFSDFTDYGDNYAFFTTPGFFDMIDKTDQLQQAWNYEYDFQWVLNTGLLTSNYLPKKYLSFTRTGEEEGRFDTTRDLPQYHNRYKAFDANAPEKMQPRRNTSGKVPVTKPSQDQDNTYTNYTLPIYCWDWGEPSYCQERLTALGFNLGL